MTLIQRIRSLGLECTGAQVHQDNASILHELLRSPSPDLDAIQAALAIPPPPPPPSP